MTYIFLLFIDMTNLKPDVFLAERSRRVVDNVFEALQVKFSESFPRQ
jgi:hypothetical protein